MKQARRPAWPELRGENTAFIAILMNCAKALAMQAIFSTSFFFKCYSSLYTVMVALHALALCQMKTYNIQQLTNILTKVNRYAADSCSL